MKFSSIIPFVLGLASINTAGALDVERRSLQHHTCELEVTMIYPTSLEIERCIGTPSSTQCTATKDFTFTVTNPAEETVTLNLASLFVDPENPTDVQQLPITGHLSPGETIQVTYSEAKIPLYRQPGTYDAEVRVSGLSLSDNAMCIGSTTVPLEVSPPICTSLEVSVEPTVLELEQCTSGDLNDPACKHQVPIQLAFTNSGTAGDSEVFVFVVENDDSQPGEDFLMHELVRPGESLEGSFDRSFDISAAGSYTREYSVIVFLLNNIPCEELVAAIEVTVAESEVRRHRNLRRFNNNNNNNKNDGMAAATTETI